jgi:hypothetical protein
MLLARSVVQLWEVSAKCYEDLGVSIVRPEMEVRPLRTVAVGDDRNRAGGCVGAGSRDLVNIGEGLYEGVLQCEIDRDGE